MDAAEEWPDSRSIYGYRPTKWICALFVALFALSTAIHTAQAVRHRLWWLLATTVLCGLGETIGWGGRLWSSEDLWNRTPFMIQICCTILSPTFLVAANFIILGRLIRLIGEQYSRLKPNAYAYVFLAIDTASLVVQAVGGAQASIAITLDAANRGAKVMLGGIILQFVAIIFYVALATEFFIRYFTDRPIRKVGATPRLAQLDSGIKLMVTGLVVGTVFILIRTVYRTIELADGWTGAIIHNERLFNALDGMPIVVALFTISLFHPGRLIWNTGRVVPQPGQAPGEEAGMAQFGRQPVATGPARSGGYTPSKESA